MNKKATVKDVAREAGVSVATVSYIMNNRTDMKISEATRKKVLQIANLLDYTPSHVAKSLATGRSNVIGISYHLNDRTFARNLEISNMVNLLIRRLNRLGYDVMYMPFQSDCPCPVSGRTVDAILAIDLKESEFSILSNSFLVPIINIDMIINDPLFYQIYTDFSKLLKKAVSVVGDEFIILSNTFANENYREYIFSGIDPEKVFFISDSNKDCLKNIRSKKVIIIGTYTALAACGYANPDNTVIIGYNQPDILIAGGFHFIENDIRKKANLAINILLNSIDKKFDVDHIYKV